LGGKRATSSPKAASQARATRAQRIQRACAWKRPARASASAYQARKAPAVAWAASGKERSSWRGVRAPPPGGGGPPRPRRHRAPLAEVGGPPAQVAQAVAVEPARLVEFARPLGQQAPADDPDARPLDDGPDEPVGRLEQHRHPAHGPGPGANQGRPAGGLAPK